ncbi:hypothetical protein [Legionella drancourtii]|uniref:Uncharacterized protein n=1 Tax=Legionella drancourtii LLAP12 TaxID=658187 RepID=G9ERV2_9GAMM|nr:hypothetical protein [Legionella drancourtii]EHL30020.1 hypothetical protein LDG_8020 [Legionella drancourtii LLAP12]
MKSLENPNNDRLIIQDEAHLMFEPLSKIEGFKELQIIAQEFGATIKQAIVNKLEIEKLCKIKSD